MSAPSAPSTSLLNDSQHTLTTFGNPFDEEEAENSSYALVSSLLSKVKSTFASSSTSTASPVPSSSSTAVAPYAPTPSNVATSTAVPPDVPKVASRPAVHPRVQNVRDRPPAALAGLRRVAPPLVSTTPAIYERPSAHNEPELRSARSTETFFSFPTLENIHEASSTIPGFPIQDDVRSIRTSNSLKRFGSASKVIRRLRGDGLSKDYWMDDALCKECYDCKSTFTTWRRKHHCRICGQIYCSRCASNIIRGSRFGQDGDVRVCNLCLQMLEDDNYDDEDDRRSVSSMQSFSFPAHQLESVKSAYLVPQSPFSAQNILSQSYDAFSLFAIPESRSATRVQLGSGASTENLVEGDAAAPSPAVAPFPFRRNLDEDKVASSPPGPNADTDDAIEHYLSDSESKSAPMRASESQPSSRPVRPTVSIAFPTDPVESFIVFPGHGSSSPDRSDSPRPLRSRVSSFATDLEAGTPPRLRSRVPSRLTPRDVGIAGEPGWRTRRESTAYHSELSGASLFHMRMLLRQLLIRAEVPRIKDWEETLLALGRRVADRFTHNPRAPGASMDVRSYIKIKKIPGGRPRDSEYVDGAVITKNVAHKAMVHDIRHPRVMLVTFPFDYHRVEGQFMPLDPLLAQEKEYLSNLVSRVSALRPHLVLVESSVSRTALDYLLKANIAVARGVKHKSLQFVARATQGQILTSMDKLLVTDPQMGHCSRFRLQTFEHHLIPGRRKTYMRFEGCSPDAAGTIILRGENVEVLKKVKQVASFLLFVVRNLKMETYLWKDTIITMPPMTREAAPLSYCHSTGDAEHEADSHDMHTSDLEPSHPRPAMITDSPSTPQHELSRRIQDSISPYINNFISASATLRFPPPYAIWRMKELDDRVAELKQMKDDAEQAAIMQESLEAASMSTSRRSSTQLSAHAPIDFDEPADDDDGPNTPLARAISLPVQAEDAPQPGTSLKRSMSHSSILSRLSSGSSSGANPSTSFAYAASMRGFPSAVPDPLPAPGLRMASEIALESALNEARFAHAEQQRIWEWYLRKNPDDFAAHAYQCIYVRQFSIPTLGMTLAPACQMPRLTRITYYGQNDCTLGQYVEDSVIEALDARRTCGGKGCRKLAGAHSKVYVHNESRVVVAVEPWTPASSHEASSAMMPDKLASFSVCRVCFQTTPFIPISEEALKYSFGKFLELHFYPADVQLIHGAGCEHNIYLHHIRYFAWRGMTVRFQTDPVDIYELVLPPMRTIGHMELGLELKNRDYESLLSRLAAYWQSVTNRIMQLQIQTRQSSPNERSSDMLDEASNLLMRAEADRQALAKSVQGCYVDTRPTDTLALGEVRSVIQNMVVEWDSRLERYERLFSASRSRLLSDKDFRRLAGLTGTHHFKRIYGDFFGGSSASEIDEKSDYPADEHDLSMLSETESLDEKQPLPAFAPLDPLPTVAESEPSETPPPSSPTPQESSDDADSDSTISAHTRRTDEHAPKEDGPATAEPHRSTEEAADEADEPATRPNRIESRLPRWQGNKRSVADLVRQFQTQRDAPPTAFPRDAEGENDMTMDSDAPSIPRPTFERRRTKSSHKPKPQDSATSDFENSYAVNVAPRQTAVRRVSGKMGPAAASSRIPALRRPSYSATQESPLSDSFPAEAPEGSTVGPDRRSRAKGKTVQRFPTRTTARSNQAKAAPRSAPTGTMSKVTNLTRQFERMSKDTERANRRYAVMKGRKARPVASARAKVAVFNNIKELRDATMDDDSTDSSSEADDEDDGEEDPNALQNSDPKVDVSVPVVETGTAAPPSSDVALQPVAVGVIPPTPEAPPLDLPPSPTHADTQEESSMLSRTSTMVSTLSERSGDENMMSRTSSEVSNAESTSSMIGTVSAWFRGQNIVALQYPFGAAEHMFAENTITVREDEPTSIIAFTLNSRDHRSAMSRAKASRKSTGQEAGEAFMPDDTSDTRSNWDVISLADAPDVSHLNRGPTPNITHLSLQFESGGVAISCIVFCAEQFEALRRTCQCDQTVIESLARCIKWDASGGKSGSAFLKTRDERFIAKELSKSELDSMLSFAPAYFDYMSNAIGSKRPTLLAKIFGVYKIACRNPILGKTIRMNLLVMENLFYGRQFAKIYDLKGSMRNRRVQSTGRPNEVLLDENLVHTSYQLPFYLREHSKRIIRGAIWNDTQFLAKFNIMDYSLLVAVENEKSELVVGIVDYIRTYTWDKRLETWVKESAFLGGGSNGQREPTIVTPKQYKARFRAAMERYFPLVPDRWTKIDDAPDNEGDDLLEMWPDW